MNYLDSSFGEIAKQALANLVRIGLVWLLGAIATKYPAVSHFINDWVTSHGGVTTLSISIAGALIIYAWSFYTRMRMRLFAKVALQSSPNASLAQVNQTVKEAPIAAVLTADATKV